MKFQIGDRVRITRKAIDHERGWQNSWVSPMNLTVGKLGTITHISPNLRHNIDVKVHHLTAHEWGYPAFVLKLEPKKKKAKK